MDIHFLENSQTITQIWHIPAVRKYIAQRQWRKLCILFKIYPELVDFNNNGQYTVHYTAHYIRGKALNMFKLTQDFFEIQPKDKLNANRLIIRKEASEYFFTIIKKEFCTESETNLKNLLKSYDYPLTIVRELNITNTKI